MSEESMVDRVARVLEPQAWAALGTGDTLAYKNRRTSSLRKARAAIEEVRKRLLEMVDRPGAIEPGYDVENHRTVWEEMIDAALKETA